MKHVLLLCFSAVWVLLAGCQYRQGSSLPPKTATKSVGGGCDGCELMYVNMPALITAESTSPGWLEPGQKLVVTGSVFQRDGITPSPDVIIYYWQTDSRGYYSPAPGLDERARRHGHIRGWVKTDAQGRYTIRTIRPGPYPGQTMPAHIHLSIKEPHIANEYYTDEINFDDDKLLIPYLKQHPQENRGGSGIVRVLLQDSLQIAEHDIILGLHIPGYPEPAQTREPSGLEPGQDQPSFTPYHAYGPDKGTRTCPVCKYGRYHGIIYFVGNNPDWPAIRQWLLFLEKESVLRSKYLKVYFVYGNANQYDRQGRQRELETLGQKLNLRNLALCFVPSFSDKTTEVNLNRINPAAQNTFIIFRHRRIIRKFVNLPPDTGSFATLKKALDDTKNDLFELPEPVYH